MKSLKFLMAVITCLIMTSFTTIDPPEKVKDLLDKAGMTLNVPEGLIEAEIIENNHMNYEYALKHPKGEFEIRYAIRPLGEMVKDHEEWEKNKKEGDIRIHPNEMYPAVGSAVAFNISGKMANLSPFDDEAVKKEYYADKGGVTSVEPRDSFANGYKTCLMIVIQKDNVATAYIFLLANDKEALVKALTQASYSLKFKP
ncbi:MAG: hypothetical protein ACK5KT_08140 [Dysgonomonas sp.]